MRLAVLALLSLAVGLGAALLARRRAFPFRVRRRSVAIAHGAIGATGLAGLLWAASTTSGTQATWFAIVLLAAGLLAGGTIFVIARRGRAPPALILALHVVFAGMGYMLCIGLILS